MEGIRVVHACWNQSIIESLSDQLNSDNTLNLDLLVKASQKGTDQYQGIETLLKGMEIPLPDGLIFSDKDGNSRSNIRIKWWSNEVLTYQKMAMVDDDVRESLPDTLIENIDNSIGYPEHEKPLFLGHYWLKGNPTLIENNIACLDYSIAKGGSLCAYRWDGESILKEDKFEHTE